MGKVIDLKDFILRSQEEDCEQTNDILLFWDGEKLVELQDGLPRVTDANIIALGNR